MHGAVTRVLVDTTDRERTSTNIGVPENILEASWRPTISFVFGRLRAHRS